MGISNCQVKGSTYIPVRPIFRFLLNQSTLTLAACPPLHVFARLICSAFTCEQWSSQLEVRGGECVPHIPRWERPPGVCSPSSHCSLGGTENWLGGQLLLPHIHRLVSVHQHREAARGGLLSGQSLFSAPLAPTSALPIDIFSRAWTVRCSSCLGRCCLRCMVATRESVAVGRPQIPCTDPCVCAPKPVTGSQKSLW